MTARRKPPLPPDYLAHRGHVYHVRGTNRDSSLDVFGPVELALLTVRRRPAC